MSEALKSSHIVLAAGSLGAVGIAALAFVLVNAPGPNRPTPEKSVSLVELIGTKYPLGRTIEALASPEIGAPTLTRVRQGSEVNVVGIVQGDGWYQIELPDKRVAYVQVGAIPAASAPPAAAAEAVPPAPAVTPPSLPEDTGALPTAPSGAPLATAADEPPAGDMPQTIAFDEAHDILKVLNPSAVYLKPSRLAPQAYPVDVGTLVYVVARSKDGTWAWVATEDDAPAYMPLADVGP